MIDNSFPIPLKNNFQEVGLGFDFIEGKFVEFFLIKPITTKDSHTVKSMGLKNTSTQELTRMNPLGVGWVVGATKSTSNPICVNTSRHGLFNS